MTARNSVGSSLDSEIVSILAAKVPDAPINLADNTAVTTAYQIGLTWEEGAYNGGSAVIDYQLSYKQAEQSDFVIYASNILPQSHTITGLTPGQNYDFIVEARNVKGYSVVSGQIQILAAQIPDVPENLQNNPLITNAHQVGLTWNPPTFDGGSAVIDYRLWSDNASGSTFTEVQSGITDTSFTVTGLTQGLTYKFKLQARNVYGYSATYSLVLTVLTA